jgi:hypothetical protein
VSALLDAVDSLYEAAVMEPQSWTPQGVADWMEGISADRSIDPQTAKLLRRVIKTAERLQDFWVVDSRQSDLSVPWQSRVDLALGPRAWRPVLDLARHALDQHPTQETFDTVGALFRLVNNRPWLDGLTFEEWVRDPSANGSQG